MWSVVYVILGREWARSDKRNKLDTADPCRRLFGGGDRRNAHGGPWFMLFRVENTPNIFVECPGLVANDQRRHHQIVRKSFAPPTPRSTEKVGAAGGVMASGW